MAVEPVSPQRFRAFAWDAVTCLEGRVGDQRGTILTPSLAQATACSALTSAPGQPMLAALFLGPLIPLLLMGSLTVKHLQLHAP